MVKSAGRRLVAISSGNAVGLDVERRSEHVLSVPFGSICDCRPSGGQQGNVLGGQISVNDLVEAPPKSSAGVDVGSRNALV